ncbi:MAG: hypothetical protein U0V48_00135 [Anaerolineales bacterium]
MSEELVTFFKALADANRLKIVGLLAEKPYSVEELARAPVDLGGHCVASFDAACGDGVDHLARRKLLHGLSVGSKEARKDRGKYVLAR